MTLEDKKNEYKELLRQGIVEVEFTKVNGEYRVMPCTLNEHLIPPAPVKELKEGELPKPPRKESPEVIRVFCIDKQEWRSFRIDSVISISLIQEKQ